MSQSGPYPECVDVRVLEEQEMIVDAVLEQARHQGMGIAVVHPAEPPDPKHAQALQLL